MTGVSTDHQVRLGLRENAAQFTLLVAVNALVGGMVGQQQTVLPLLAQQQFGLTGYSFIFAYVAAFGITKAATNYWPYEQPGRLVGSPNQRARGPEPPRGKYPTILEIGTGAEFVRTRLTTERIRPKTFGHGLR